VQSYADEDVYALGLLPRRRGRSFRDMFVFLFFFLLRLIPPFSHRFRLRRFLASSPRSCYRIAIYRIIRTKKRLYYEPYVTATSLHCESAQLCPPLCLRLQWTTPGSSAVMT
jgi:hypothetical protein